MKESFGGISLFTIVIVFVMLFASYVSLSINYSKAYNVKNELVNIIKNQGGICTEGSVPGNNCDNFPELVSTYFRDVGYHSSGKCEGNEYGFTRDGVKALSGQKAAFCISAVKALDDSELPDSVYYKVRIFYQLDIPIFESIFNFALTGETVRVYDPNECENYEGQSWC